MYIFFILFLIILDLGSKKYVSKKYKLNEKINVYKDKIYIYHIKNEGLAYGFLKNSKKAIYIISSFCITILSIFAFVSFKEKSRLRKIAFSFALGGAFGNFIDRIKNKKITDFLYIKHKNAPIFNLADIFLFISPILMIIKEIKDFISKR